MLSFQYAFPKENVGIAPINTLFCKSFNESKPLKYREIHLIIQFFIKIYH